VARSIVRSVIAGTLLLAAHASLADGQIGRRPVARRPINWFGAGVGIVQPYHLQDGVSGSSWEFGSGIEYAGRLLHPTRSGILIGAQASYSRAPLSYVSATTCGRCEATARVTQLMGVARYGQGYAFHPVYELSAGAISYSHFRETSTNAELAPRTRDYDFRFALAYGFALGLSPTASIEILQEIGTILHQKTGLPASTSNYPRVLVTRIGGKVAF
jgi:hypothetical protein